MANGWLFFVVGFCAGSWVMLIFCVFVDRRTEKRLRELLQEGRR